METGKVFISSILDRKAEDLSAERAAVKKAVDSFRFLRVWAFEDTPASIEPLDQSYLRHVDECDLFIVLIGSEVTSPVNREILRAKHLGKPILVFVKAVAQRSSEAEMALEALGRKYAGFATVEELEEKACAAIGETLVLALRTYKPSGNARPSIEEELAKLVRTRVRISPTMPRDNRQDLYTLDRLASGKAYFSQGPLGCSLEVPVSRVIEILPNTDVERPTLLISGRVQWITTQRAWQFRSEAIPDDSLLGLGRVSSPGDHEIVEIKQKIGPQGYGDVCWDWRNNLSDRLQHGWEVFYGEDGRYLRYVAPPDEQIFFVKRR